MQYLPTIITLLLLAFCLWMLVDMIKNPDISRQHRIYWLLGFIFFGLIAAGFYYFVHYIKR